MATTVEIEYPSSLNLCNSVEASVASKRCCNDGQVIVSEDDTLNEPCLKPKLCSASVNQQPFPKILPVPLSVPSQSQYLHADGQLWNCATINNATVSTPITTTNSNNNNNTASLHASTDSLSIDIAKDVGMSPVDASKNKIKPRQIELEQGSKDATVTKLLIGVSAAVIVYANQIHTTGRRKYCWEKVVEVMSHWVAMLLMIAGLYLQVNFPSVSKMLQRFGHLICLMCLMFMDIPLLHLPNTYIWIPPVVSVVILGYAMWFAG